MALSVLQNKQLVVCPRFNSPKFVQQKRVEHHEYYQPAIHGKITGKSQQCQSTKQAVNFKTEMTF
jgi:hypothetical protein